MKPILILTALAIIAAVAAAASPSTRASSDHGTKLLPVAPQSFPQLFIWTDTCNVYVLKDGDAAILVDLGDGSVLDHLHEIGVKHADWVLFTSHHRELCQGYPRLQGSGAKIAAPERERAFFENPASFRKMKPDLFDPFTVHSSSYLRPSIRPIPLDRGFNRVDTFTWHGYDIACIETHGNSPAAMTYLIRHGDKNYAMSGDLMVDGARMYNWFDSEWDYCFGAGTFALQEGINVLAAAEPDMLLPAHGPPVLDPKTQLAAYHDKVQHIERLILRTYRTVVFIPTDQDRISKPTVVPNVRQVLPHLFKFRGANYVPNFSMILSDSGHALLIDCGRVGSSMLDESLKLMKERLGLKQVDAVIITHMHGDHCTDVPHLREKWGAKVWTLDSFVDMFEHPTRFDYIALIESYGVGVDSFKVDRALKPGETIQWEGYTFTIDHMPGQTDFALSVRGMIDGQSVVFTGDNIFGNTRDPNQNGHDALSSRNQAIIEEGYILGAEYLTKLKPDLIMGGHSWVMDKPAEMVERYRKWAYDLRDALHGLSGEEDYYRWFDPFWVRAEPYRSTL